ncbi:DegT/DnrJ/EryC1/StrS aminotransferase family protein [candidate division KSB1 bacterium]|nr:DegT/DnrJ/EryC1/StrS aminotransferase family protein [candidate division KSB1 bacterium]
MKTANGDDRGEHSIPFCLPLIGEKEVEQVVAALRSGWITTGPRTLDFEQHFAKAVHARHAIAVNSCTAALHLSLASLDLQQGDEVITTPYTFAATGETILYTGAIPVFADVLPNQFNIDPAAIALAINGRTRAIVPVHFGGEACNMGEIVELAQRYGLPVIEDAAHALGTRYFGKTIGSIGTTTCFSFYAIKNLTTGEGGMITTNDGDRADRLRRLSLHGLSKDAWKRYDDKSNWYYEIRELGYKYNMSDIQAAIGLEQLHKFHHHQQIRKTLARFYLDAFAGMDEIELPPFRNFAENAWHLFVIRIRQEKLTLGRDDFIRALQDKGIGCSVHFMPLHLHPFYRDRFGYRPGDYPHAESVYERAISLPLYPRMSLQDAAYVSETVKKIVALNRKRIIAVSVAL